MNDANSAPCANNAPEKPLVTTTELRSLRSAVGEGGQPLIVAIHDYPDPDAIAAALAMQTLAGAWGINAVIAHGGVIGRADNNEMVTLLKIDMKPFSSIKNIGGYRGAVLVDTQPTARNQSLPDGIPVLAVVDHHILSSESVRADAGVQSPGVAHSDVRSDVGASSTLAFGYLEAAGISPDARLATALFLGIKTDTDGLLRGAYPADVRAYTRLLPLSDLSLAAKATHPPLGRDYYYFLHYAVSKTALYGTALISYCAEVKTPDLLSTASDYLVSLGGTEYALAVGFHGDRAYLSLRSKPPKFDATRVILQVVEPEGKGGGHSLSAGGFINVDDDRDKWLEHIRSRFLDATGNAGCSKEDLIV